MRQIGATPSVAALAHRLRWLPDHERRDTHTDRQIGATHCVTTIATVLHELWDYDDGATFCLAGPHGDGARRMMPRDAALVWTVEADSHFEAMAKYYEHMGWGTYTTDFPDIDRTHYSERNWDDQYRRVPGPAARRKGVGRHRTTSVERQLCVEERLDLIGKSSKVRAGTEGKDCRHRPLRR